MKNEFGAELDRNGYAPSILGNYRYCAICHRSDRPLQRHEVFHGADRSRSKRYGLWVSLCDCCHREVHSKGEADLRLKVWAQKHAMTVYNWTEADFRKHFRKNYV